MTLQAHPVRHQHSPVTTPRGAERPFAEHVPASVPDRAWVAVLAAVAVAGIVDMYLAIPGPAWAAMVVRGAVFATIPLLAYVLAAPGHARALVTTFHRRDLRTVLAVWIGTLLASSAVGVLLASMTHLHANPAGDVIAQSSLGDRLLLFAAMVPQLFGEEVFTVLLLLATTALASRHLHLSRRAVVVLGIVVSTVAFAALHLPTYGWNVLQCLAVIGTARIVLTLAFLKSRSVLVSTAAHVLNDWTLFGAGLLG